MPKTLATATVDRSTTHVETSGDSIAYTAIAGKENTELTSRHVDITDNDGELRRASREGLALMPGSSIGREPHDEELSLTRARCSLRLVSSH